MTFNGLKRMLSVSTQNAFNFFASPMPERRIDFHVYQDMLEEKHAYRRPEFLQLDEESTQASADHESRPILIPHRELPLNAGYAETINAGKSLHVNEDQAVAGMFCLCVTKTTSDVADGSPSHIIQTKIPYAYFGVFDGHAGTGAALMAMSTLHIHIEDNLGGVKDLLACSNNDELQKAPRLSEAVVSSITINSLVIGALEEAFFEMDEHIRRERSTYKISGGCTALVSLFLGKKLYVACAGDSRAVICHKGKVIAMSRDCTPETERQRLQQLAYQKPQLLGSEFSRLEFQQRARKKYVGQKLLYRDRHMTGWSLKTVTEEDARKFPMVTGEGKRARLLDTIGTTRGFGDHDLTVSYCGLPIKPFLTPQPEVKVFDLPDHECTADDVLIMASDGLWERLSSEEACANVMETFRRVSKEDKRRYVVASQTLVSEARGTMTDRGWRRSNGEIASYDDITVLVIPLNAHSGTEPITYEYDPPIVKPTYVIPEDSQSDS